MVGWVGVLLKVFSFVNLWCDGRGWFGVEVVWVLGCEGVEILLFIYMEFLIDMIVV